MKIYKEYTQNCIMGFRGDGERQLWYEWAQLVRVVWFLRLEQRQRQQQQWQQQRHGGCLRSPNRLCHRQQGCCRDNKSIAKLQGYAQKHEPGQLGSNW